MPRLVKGGKWVFGWLIVGAWGQVRIPPEAMNEYGFRAGDRFVWLPGSRTSGGCALARLETLAGCGSPTVSSSIGEGHVGANGEVAVPDAVGCSPGDRLLAVRGSGLALGLVRQGPIYDEALRHSEIDTFESA